jgi:hypothetical protein
MPEPSCRLYVVLARRAPVGVIFRRGPTRHVRLISWNLEDDTFEPGQWLNGRVYERRCDLSPRGDLLIYFAAKHRPPFGSWTAVSRPPWFTALALWPKGDCWGGGGLFKNGRLIQLNHWSCQMTLADGFRLPSSIAVAPLGDRAGCGEDDPIEGARLVRDGWKLVRPGTLQAEQHRESLRWRFSLDRLWQKPQPGASRHALRMLVRGIGERDGPWYRLDHDVVDADGQIRVYLPGTDWADWDRNGDLLFSREGALFRLAADMIGHGNDFGEQAGRLADFTDMSFEPIAAPGSATHW